jgi:hypothetical protein
MINFLRIIRLKQIATTIYNNLPWEKDANKFADEDINDCSQQKQSA